MTQRHKEAAKASHATPASDSVPDDLVELGWVAGAHGIKGWIKIQPFSSDSQALGATKRWWLADPSTNSPLAARKKEQRPPFAVELDWARPHGATWLASVKGIVDREQAEALKGRTVMVSRRLFPALPDDEFYWVDLIGCVVTTDELGEPARLGIVESVQDNPAHPILVVRQQVASSDGDWGDRLDDKGKAVYSLIPFVKAHVGEIDISAKRIASHWPSDF